MVVSGKNLSRLSIYLGLFHLRLGLYLGLFLLMNVGG